MTIIFDPKLIDQKVREEINYFLENESDLKSDIEYVFNISIPDRPKAYLMLQFANVLGVEKEKIMPFVLVSDLMMAAAMNDDDIIDNNPERCGEVALWKMRGINSTIMVTGYMYALIFSILKKYRPSVDNTDFLSYQKSEDLLLDYFRTMHIAQYNTTRSRELDKLGLADLEILASEKASLLFQFCCAAPAYFAGIYESDLEKFGYDLGIARQYISDIQDFMAVEGDSYKDSIRMEDYFTHQPNLVLVLTGISKNLDKEETDWFYKNWKRDIPDSERESTTEKVMSLINKAESINIARGELKKIKERLQSHISVLPNNEFKETIPQWAFRMFPVE